MQYLVPLLRGVCKIAKSDFWLRHVFPHACLCVSMEHSGSHWTDFHEILYLSIFLKSVEKIQILLKSDKNNGYFSMKTNTNCSSYLVQFFL